MAKAAGLSQKFYMHGKDLSGDVAAITNAEGSFADLDFTDITQPAHARDLGIAAGMMEWESFFNDAALRSHTVLSALPKTDVVVTWILGAAIGSRTLSLQAKLAQAMGVQRPNDGSLTLTSRAEGSAGAPLEDGLALTAGDDSFASASSATGVLAVDGVQTTLGAAAICHVLSIGSGTPTILLEDSSDSTNGIDGAWATLLTFGAQAVETGLRVTSTTNVEKWVRITMTGTFTDCVVVITLRRGLADDIEDLS